MLRYTLYFPVETPENPFVAPVNIETIEAFMNRVSYQGVVDKVKAFYTKNLAQPWKTMFKGVTNVDYVALLLWDFIKNVKQKKEAIKTPTLTTNPQRKKRKQTAGESSSLRKSHKLTIKWKKPSIISIPPPNDDRERDEITEATLLKIPQRIEEDYHSIKDDIPLVSVYTTGDVRVRGMVIPNVFLTEEICHTPKRGLDDVIIYITQDTKNDL
nr:hypothetical protein [Tanacetum cinerariifolium]